VGDLVIGHALQHDERKHFAMFGTQSGHCRSDTLDRRESITLFNKIDFMRKIQRFDVNGMALTATVIAPSVDQDHEKPAVQARVIPQLIAISKRFGHGVLNQVSGQVRIVAPGIREPIEPMPHRFDVTLEGPRLVKQFGFPGKWSSAQRYL